MAQFGIGQPVRRKEDVHLVTGQGCFTDDINLKNQAHVFFLRSPYGHAEIGSVDTADAEAAPGVIAIFTGKDASDPGFPVRRCLADIKPKQGHEFFSPVTPVLVIDRVRFVDWPMMDGSQQSNT